MRPLRTLPMLLSLALLAPFVTAQEATPLMATLTPGEVENIDIHVGDGSLHLSGGSGDQIEVEVRLLPKGGHKMTLERTRRVIARTHLNSKPNGDWIFFELDYPSEAVQGEIEERWTVRVPPGFGAEVEMAVGELAVNNLAGGVDLQLGVGEMDVMVPRGDIKASVAVGELTVMSSTASPGAISLAADAGHSKLIVNGEAVKAKRAHGPGSAVWLRGEGEDSIDLSVSVGNVVLKILEQP